MQATLLGRLTPSAVHRASHLQMLDVSFWVWFAGHRRLGAQISVLVSA